MITEVKLSDAGTTVRDLRALFDDEHVHAAVIVELGLLLTIVDRSDLADVSNDHTLARNIGQRARRVIGPEADLEQARRSMVSANRRRLAVVDADGRFRGLLCLKRTRQGFCSNRDVRARSAAIRRT